MPVFLTLFTYIFANVIAIASISVVNTICLLFSPAMSLELIASSLQAFMF